MTVCLPTEWSKRFRADSFEIVLAEVRLSRAYIAGMKQQNWGRIIFISSESGIFTPKEMIHYGMTKTAQLAVSRGLAEYCGGTGVTVNSILPGPTHSAGLEEFVTQFGGGQSFEAIEKEFFKSVRPSSLIKRFETPDEIARLVTFVCSPSRLSHQRGPSARGWWGCFLMFLTGNASPPHDVDQHA